MNMEDLLLRNRIYNLLTKKAEILGGGEEMDLLDLLGQGEGVLVGGARRKKSDSRAARGRKVAAYMRKHGVTLPVASRAISRMSGSKRKTYRRKRGGEDEDDDLDILRQQYALQRKKLSKTAKDAYCKDIKPKNYKSLTMYKKALRDCMGDFSEIKKQALDELLAPAIKKKLKKE